MRAKKLIKVNEAISPVAFPSNRLICFDFYVSGLFYKLQMLKYGYVLNYVTWEDINNPFLWNMVQT